MAKGRGAYKSDKRKKELLRHKKQEEKRQRRFKNDVATDKKNETEPLKETESSTDSPPEGNASSCNCDC